MTIQDLHNKAMELADQGDFLKMQGKIDDALTFYDKSLEAEREAAYSARRQNLGEPSESVLFRSAASLAYSIKDFREAERLICMGLAGNPPVEIAEELRSLYDTVNFDRKMESMEVSNSEEHQSVTVTLPAHERNLLKVLVKKFGWACIF